MTVIYKEPGKEPELREIDNTLEALQEAVGGYIETVTLAPRNICVICNEEGRLNGMPFNCVIGGLAFVGPILLAGVDGEEFGDVPMPQFWLTRLAIR